jgi:hypothetical protein
MHEIAEAIIRATEVRRGNGAIVLIITGNDPDAVWSAALDVKNAAGLVRAPLLSMLEAAVAPGWWQCCITQRSRHVPLG